MPTLLYSVFGLPVYLYQFLVKIPPGTLQVLSKTYRGNTMQKCKQVKG